MTFASLIIVNWNSREHLSECLDSIRDCGGRGIGEIIVVDNASTDGSDLRAKAYSGVRVIELQENVGFAKACNLGARQARGAYFLFLNPDTKLYRNSIEGALRFMDSKEAADIGICGIRLIDSEGNTHRHCAHFPTWRTYFGHAFGLDYVLPGFFRSHFMTAFDHKSSRQVDQVIGAYFLVRREAFKELGGFDERFFVYMEDLDFSLRARQAGWRSWYLADIHAYHKGGGTSEQVKAIRLFYSLRSRILYGFKHFSPLAAWVVLALTLGAEPIARLIRCALRRSFQESHDTTRAYCMLWRDMPNVVRTAFAGR